MIYYLVIFVFCRGWKYLLRREERFNVYNYLLRFSRLVGVNLEEFFFMSILIDILMEIEI